MPVQVERNPSRQLANSGRQPSVRFALALDEPRTSVITDAGIANDEPCKPDWQLERRPGADEPGKLGQLQIDTSAGSSSTML